MKNWRLKDAKENFSQMVKLARTEGPQAVIQRGKTIALVVSPEDLKQSAPQPETVLEFFAPLKGSGVQLRRHRDLPRKVRF